MRGAAGGLGGGREGKGGAGTRCWGALESELLTVRNHVLIVHHRRFIVSSWHGYPA